MLTDIKGNPVKLGDLVRVLNFERSALWFLSAEEQKDVLSMVGEVLGIQEIDESGCAWVKKWWDRGDGKFESYNLRLTSGDMEKVSDVNQ